jgi:hypothetical protein
LAYECLNIKDEFLVVKHKIGNLKCEYSKGVIKSDLLTNRILINYIISYVSQLPYVLKCYLAVICDDELIEIFEKGEKLELSKSRYYVNGLERDLVELADLHRLLVQIVKMLYDLRKIQFVGNLNFDDLMMVGNEVKINNFSSCKFKGIRFGLDLENTDYYNFITQMLIKPEYFYQFFNSSLRYVFWDPIWEDSNLAYEYLYECMLSNTEFKLKYFKLKDVIEDIYKLI